MKIQVLAEVLDICNSFEGEHDVTDKIELLVQLKNKDNDFKTKFYHESLLPANLRTIGTVVLLTIDTKAGISITEVSDIDQRAFKDHYIQAKEDIWKDFDPAAFCDL